MTKHIEIVAKGCMYDCAKDDTIIWLSRKGYQFDQEEFAEDFSAYRKIALMSDDLFDFVVLKFLTESSTENAYMQFLDQKDYGITNFMDFVIAEFTRGSKILYIDESERDYIQNLLTQRLENNLNVSRYDQ